GKVDIEGSFQYNNTSSQATITITAPASSFTSGAAFTLGSSGVLSTAAAGITLTAPSLSNAGVISAVAGHINITTASLANNGSISASGTTTSGQAAAIN